jgi:hypothetical protein
MQNLMFPVFKAFWDKQLLRLQAQCSRAGAPTFMITLTANDHLLEEWKATIPPCGNGDMPGTFPWLSEAVFDARMRVVLKRFGDFLKFFLGARITAFYRRYENNGRGNEHTHILIWARANTADGSFEPPNDRFLTEIFICAFLMPADTWARFLAEKY